MPVDRKDIKVCFGDEKSKLSNIPVQCVFSRNQVFMVFSGNQVCCHVTHFVRTGLPYYDAIYYDVAKYLNKSNFFV